MDIYLNVFSFQSFIISVSIGCVKVVFISLLNVS